MSGLGTQMVANQVEELRIFRMVDKPFEPNTLLDAVRDAAAEGAAPPGRLRDLIRIPHQFQAPRMWRDISRMRHVAVGSPKLAPVPRFFIQSLELAIPPWPCVSDDSTVASHPCVPCLPRHVSAVSVSDDHLPSRDECAVPCLASIRSSRRGRGRVLRPEAPALSAEILHRLPQR